MERGSFVLEFNFLSEYARFGSLRSKRSKFCFLSPVAVPYMIIHYVRLQGQYFGLKKSSFTINYFSNLSYTPAQDEEQEINIIRRNTNYFSSAFGAYLGINPKHVCMFRIIFALLVQTMELLQQELQSSSCKSGKRQSCKMMMLKAPSNNQLSRKMNISPCSTLNKGK